MEKNIRKFETGDLNNYNLSRRRELNPRPADYESAAQPG